MSEAYTQYSISAKTISGLAPIADGKPMNITVYKNWKYYDSLYF